MTKVIDTENVSLPEFLRRDNESTDLAGALRVAGEGAVALAQGSSTAGLFVARKGATIAKEIVTRARRARKEGPAALVTAPRKRRSGRTVLITAGALGVIAVGGTVFYRSRRPAHPPIAPEPPRVRPISADENPAEG